jgi:hypothetical protein
MFWRVEIIWQEKEIFYHKLVAGLKEAGIGNLNQLVRTDRF